MALGSIESERCTPGVDVASRATRVAILIVGLSVTAVVTAHLVDFGVYDLRINAMNANLGTSPVAWVSPAAILVALVASIVLVRRTRRGLIRVLPFALAIVLVLATHHVGESIPHWQVLLLAPLGVTLVVLWSAASDLHPSADRTLRSGCLLLVVAFGLHVFGASILGHLGFGVDSWPYQVKVALKEGSEISGWMLIAGALVVATGVEILNWRGRRSASRVGPI
jgi:hypothetical protein